MDTRHHVGLLLVVLVGTILLLLAASVLLICYCRRKYLKTKKHLRWPLKSEVLMKNQATSMTGVSLILSAPQPLTFHGHQAFKNSPSSVKEDLIHGKEEHPVIYSSLESQMGQKNAASPSQQIWHNSETLPLKLHEKGDQTSVLQYISSPGTSLIESILGRSKDLEFGPFHAEDRMLSSSMKSNVDVNFMLVPVESPVPHVSFINHSRSSSLPRNLGDCLAVSEGSEDQQYSWCSTTLINTLIQNSAQGQPYGLIDMNHHGEYVESLSVPSTLKRPSFTAATLEGNAAGKSLIQLPKTTGLLQPRAWFISLANRPFSNGVAFGKKDQNNITSLDSGVDVIELQVRQDREMVVKEVAESGEMIKHLRSHEESGGSEQSTTRLVREEGDEISRLMGRERLDTEKQTAHKEAAIKLNEAHYQSKRSLWQKREERPLMGIN